MVWNPVQRQSQQFQQFIPGLLLSVEKIAGIRLKTELWRQLAQERLMERKR